MNYRLLNAIRDIQVTSKECGLYLAGSIDGKWGKGSADAVKVILDDYNYRINGSRAENSPLPVPGAVMTEEAALKVIQTNLKLLKIYDGVPDGIMGPGTWGAWMKAVNSYKAYNRIAHMGIAWSTKVSEEFVSKVIAGCKARNWYENAANDLMSCMCFETGGTFSPTIRNGAGAYYFGLLQFGKAAATDMGTTVDDLIKLSAIEQLDWVFKYFDMWAKRGKRLSRLEDFYLTIFYPAAVGKKADEVIFRADVEKEKLGYTQNRGFDFNKDGKITVGEINDRLYKVYYDGMLPSNRTKSTLLY